ncbi:MAG TPA: hypothetical protein VN802_12215 [Stellaceae bacterium]|nr:hypothetical protein [Stellaceae bacterium]
MQRLTVRQLLDFYITFAKDDEIRQKPDLATIVISIRVIQHFLGDPWIAKNLSPFLNKPGFMRITFGQTAADEIRGIRIVDLAELLLNLQDIEGFDPLVERLKTADLEPAIAELHVGRILYINDVTFRFISPQGKKGDDYDLKITYSDGTVVCGETKCKIESTDLGDGKTVANALQQARGQLPSDKPGIIFLKFPQQWLEREARKKSAAILGRTAIEFFVGTDRRPGTKRVVSVKYYAEPMSYADGYAKHGHEYLEVSNPHNRFFPNRIWDLFHYRPLPGQQNALPEKWIRFHKFPQWLGKHAQT